MNSATAAGGPRTEAPSHPMGRPPAAGQEPAPALVPPPLPPRPPRPLRSLSTAELGRRGEDIAVERLEAEGWLVVERNLRLGRRGELDIIALDGDTLVFVEVKTRRSFVTGVPQAAVTPDKLARLRRLVGTYLMERSTPHRDVRIDVIAVHVHLDGTVLVEHLRAVG